VESLNDFIMKFHNVRMDFIVRVFFEILYVME